MQQKLNMLVQIL